MMINCVTFIAKLMYDKRVIQNFFSYFIINFQKSYNGCNFLASRMTFSNSFKSKMPLTHC